MISGSKHNIEDASRANLLIRYIMMVRWRVPRAIQRTLIDDTDLEHRPYTIAPEDWGLKLKCWTRSTTKRVNTIMISISVNAPWNDARECRPMNTAWLINIPMCIYSKGIRCHDESVDDIFVRVKNGTCNNHWAARCNVYLDSCIREHCELGKVGVNAYCRRLLTEPTNERKPK